jgi:hypothetical protein
VRHGAHLLKVFNAARAEQHLSDTPFESPLYFGFKAPLPDVKKEMIVGVDPKGHCRPLV